jgi:hypothetical protein
LLCSASAAAPPRPYAANVAKAVCAAGDAPEVGLQGQVTMAERNAGYKGAHCNLTLVSKLPAEFVPEKTRMFSMVRDRAGHLCGIASGEGGTTPTIVADMTDPKRIVETASLTSPAMMRSSEALKVNETRGLLVSTSYVPAHSANTNSAERTLDVYDIGTDCRQPRMLASVQLPFPTKSLKTGYHGFRWPDPDYVMGHEGNFAPDGLTFYVADSNHGVHHAIDLADPANPKLLDTFMAPSWKGYADGPDDSFIAFGAMPHSLSVSPDGNRGYFSIAAFDSRLETVPQTGEWSNGFMVLDTSEIQRRKPGGRMRFISQVTLSDGGGHHGPLSVKINGHPYVIDNDEYGAGQLSVKGRLAACRAGLPPSGMARIWDIKNERHPKLVSKLILEVNDPKNCATIEPETIAGDPQWAMFLYDTHLCSVDNRENATVLACGYMQSGIRVYDIRNPRRVKEIAYFNPPAGKPNRVRSCAGIPRLDAKTRMLYSYCAGAGFVALQFKKGVWPFPGSSTPRDMQL